MPVASSHRMLAGVRGFRARRFRYARMLALPAVVLLIGGGWVSVGQFMPEGTPRAVIGTVMAALFAAIFVADLTDRILYAFRHHTRVAPPIVLTFLSISLMLVAFALAYHRMGLINTLKDDSPTVTDWWTCVYFSIVTFTTLGFGDFSPTPAARAVACIQTVTGYLTLGILASSIASLLQSIATAEAERDDPRKPATTPSEGRNAPPAPATG